MKRKSVFTVFLTSLIFTFSNVYSQDFNLPHGTTITQLDNGIEILLIEKPSLPMIGVNAVVKVGSAYETFATSGMSHMLEHLLFNGTETMTQKELYDAVDRIGAYNNANTSEFYTNFMMVAPSDKIVKAMKIQSDMLFHSVLPPKKFEKEKGIVLEEIAKTLSDPSSQEERNVISILYHGHALSLPTLGTYETIKHMKRDDVYRFYKNYYVPNNMLISVIGNFKTAEMIKTLNEIYGKESPGNVKRPDDPTWATGFNAPTDSLLAGVYHRFYKGNKLELMFFYPLPKFKNFKTYELLETAAGRHAINLEKFLQKKFGKLVESFSLSVRANPVRSFLQATVTLSKDEKGKEILDVVNSKISRMNFDLPAATLESIAIKSRTSFYKNTEKPHMFGIFNAETFATRGIEAVLSSYSEQTIYAAGKELQGVRIKSKPVVIYQHPFPSKNKGGKGDSVLKPVLFLPSDGQPVLIVKENPGSGLLAIHYLIKNKAILESEYGKDAAWIWHDAFAQRMHNSDIQKIAWKFGFDFTVNDNPYIPMDDIYLDPNFGYIRVEALSDDIPGAIGFLNKQMLDFVPTEKEFKNALNKLMRIKMMKHSRGARKIFRQKLDSLLYVDVPFGKANKKIDYASLKQFGKKYFSPSNMIVSVVGDISPSKASELFRSFRKKVSFGKAEDRAVIKGFRNIDKSQTIEIKGGGEQSYLYFGFQKKVQENEKPALKVLSLILSDEIIFNVREKQGLAYRMSAGIEVRNNKAMFFVEVPTLPKNVNKLVPQFPLFFDASVVDSLTSEQLEKTVNMYLGRMMFRRLSSINQGY